MNNIDVLCCGLLCADLNFTLKSFPQFDEKCDAQSFGVDLGGPACNATLAINKLGGSSQLVSSTGQDLLSNSLLALLTENSFDTELITQVEKGLTSAAILTANNGQRQVISNKAQSKLLNLPLKTHSLHPKVLLFDGHQQKASLELLQEFNIPTILDAGSVHPGTLSLINKVDYLITSKKFAVSFTGKSNLQEATEALKNECNMVVVTDGENGLYWNTADSRGHIPAYPVACLNSNGAGDVFHGAFAYGLSQRYNFIDNLHFAAKTAALSCTSQNITDNIPSAETILQSL
ncbi:MAG: hypothetical protein HRT88_01085 [Lentisphaeraceae bacterium]|nr:hypothetical protein [Lentisphaeraceae bacterium]